MLSELFKAIGEQAVKAAGPQLVQPKAEPAHVYSLAMPDGSLVNRIAEPTPRDHKASDLNTIATFISDHGAEKVNVWYSRHAIVALVNDESRRDRVTLPLSFSPQLDSLHKLESKQPWLSQADFIRLLRIDLAGASGMGNLLDIVRKIKFEIGQSGESEIRTGKSSMGKSVRAEVQGAGALPEDMKLTVPVFHGHLWAADLSVAIEVDPAKSNFQLVPFPGEIEKAIRTGEAKMAGELAHWLTERKCEKVPVYYGMP